MAEVLLVIKDPIGPAEGLDQVLWAHRLAIDKECRKTRSIKACQETIDHDDQIQLLIAIEVLVLLSSQAIIDITIKASQVR